MSIKFRKSDVPTASQQGTLIAPKIGVAAQSMAPIKSITLPTGFIKRDAERATKKLELNQQATQSADLVDLAAADSLFHIPTAIDSSLIALDAAQQQVIDDLIQQRYGCIIGAPGVGKSTIIDALIMKLIDQAKARDRNISIRIMAFTGRATDMIRTKTRPEFREYVSTIHSALEYAPEYQDRMDKKTGMWRTVRVFIPHRDQYNKMDEDVLIIDEAGQDSIDLHNQYMLARKDGCRVYLVGDIYQLPPVHGRSVLGFAMQAWPTHELKKVYRTNENAILSGVASIINGTRPVTVTGKTVIFGDGYNRTKPLSADPNQAFTTTIGIVQQLTKTGVFVPTRDAFIVAQNEGILGQESFNERLCGFFNPARKAHDSDPIFINPRIQIKAGFTKHLFALGDKVMITKNDRDNGLTNGMTGVIDYIAPNPRFTGDGATDAMLAAMTDVEDFDLGDLDADVERHIAAGVQDDDDDDAVRQASHIIRVRFLGHDEPVEFATAGSVNALRYGYAFTCHKSQGGEYPVVVILCHSANSIMLTREWLLTAWSRASQKVILICDPKGLQSALSKQKIVGKTLAEKARLFIKLSARAAAGDSNVKLPILPPPERIR